LKFIFSGDPCHGALAWIRHWEGFDDVRRIDFEVD
jgi:hypothetical protein